MQRLDQPSSNHNGSGSSEELGGIALFFDVENILLGVQGEFDVHAVASFLGERGEVMILKAYADWGRYRRQQRQFLEEGVQMVFLPTYGASDKNRTDTAICVDAMEVLYTRPLIETFCIVSGDSDFGILAQRLRAHGKRVIGMSARSAASPILVKQCHEFVFYETLIGQRVAGFSVEEGEGRLKRALDRVVEEVGPEFRASIIKDRMRKQDATFSERNYGASSFTRFLANYDHLVTVMDGGLVRLAAHAPKERAPSMKQPALSADALADARAVLMRTVIEAAKRHGMGAVPLSRLKDTLLAVDADFDEVALGYKTFTQFLLAFPDVVIVDRASNSARPNVGIVPDGAEIEQAEPTRAGPERRRRTKKTAPPSADEPERATSKANPLNETPANEVASDAAPINAVAVTAASVNAVAVPEAPVNAVAVPEAPAHAVVIAAAPAHAVVVKETPTKEVIAKEPRDAREPKDTRDKRAEQRSQELPLLTAERSEGEA